MAGTDYTGVLKVLYDWQTRLAGLVAIGWLDRVLGWRQAAQSNNRGRRRAD